MARLEMWQVIRGHWEGRHSIELAYEFLLAFHSKYGIILYHFREEAEILVENRDFYTSPAFDGAVRGGGPRGDIAIAFGIRNKRSK